MSLVLVVDDSLTVRMDLADAFEAVGVRAVPCATLAEARRALELEPVELVVLDVLLPDGDGVDFLRELREAPQSAHLPVLVLSAEAEVKHRIRGLETGANEYVGKPYDRGYVVARARELLHARQAPGTDRAPVLIIDDSITFREELRELLQRGGHTVLSAGSGEDGLRLIAAQRPGALIVDGVLPGIDGATVIRRVRLDAALRGLPCILLTASEDRGAELLALDAGADAFVRKDEELEVILARLATVLRHAEQRPPDQAASTLGPKKILAVDDSPTYLHELAAALRAEGYDVVPVRSGEEALELLAVQAVDCVLLDLVMPGLGGHETCRRIKAVPVMREIPLIMLTALEDRGAMLEGLSVGADDYIAKSADFEVLKARVRAQLRRRQFEDEHRRVRERLLQKELEATEARAVRELAETRAGLVAELERKNRELEAFSYSVSHDLRAPLRSIDGFSQALLEDHADALGPRGRDYLGRVRAAAQRMAELIDDLLELSRVSRAELCVGRVDLSALAQAVVAELRRREPERTVTVDIEPGMEMAADRKLMRIVLENLLGNAWKFTSRAADAHITLGTAATEDGAGWAVCDNGAGFDVTFADKLFRPFQRLHSVSEFSGTGIGLATVQRIIDRHGGRVWADATVGAGAIFTFTVAQRQGAGGAGR